MPKPRIEKTFVKTRIKKNDEVKVIAGATRAKPAR